MRRQHYSKKEKISLYKKLAAAAFLFLFLCAAGIMAGRIADHQKIGTRENTSRADTDEVTINGVKYKPNWNIKTYLFIGEDATGVKKAKAENDGTGQSDVLELLVIDTKNNTYRKLPINRDTVTEVKSLDDDGSYLATTKTQIALAHANGDGMETSCENTVDAVSSMLYNVTIDGYMSLNIDAIKVLNHLAGGVTVTIEDDFSQSDPSLKTGETVKLTDGQAQHYVHDRINVADGTNENRMKRQKTYISALYPLFKNKMKKDSSFVNTFYNALSDYMVTDMSVGEMSNVASLIMQSEDKGELSIEGTSKIGEDGFNEFTMDKESLGEVAAELFFTRASD